MKIGRGKSIAISLIPLLLLAAASSAVVHGSPRSGTAVPPLLFQAGIPKEDFEYFNIDAAASTNVVELVASSNVSISTAFMNTPQFTAFNETESGIVNSLYLQNGTSVQKTIDVAKGDYFLVFMAYSDNANVTYNWLLYPNSPLQTGPLYPPEPTGIGTFGLNNNSGVVTPYTIESNEVVGVAYISSMLAHNSTAHLSNSSVSGATLQLNSVLVVNEQGGAQQVYWVQNTPLFINSASQVADVDNVWNYSVSGFLSNTTITSTDGGYAYSYVQNGATQYYYAQGTSNSTYVLPFDFTLMLNETVDPGVGVVVQAGTQVLRNGTAMESPAVWFDDVTIHDPTATSAYYLVAGNETTPTDSFYDTELAFGGEMNGESTSFTQMSATLQLLYDSNSTGQLTYFPSYYSFGQDTSEAANNLHVAYNGDGVAIVSIGTPNYVFLGSASGTSSLSQLEASATSSVASTTSSSSSGLSSLPLAYPIVVGIATVVILIADLGRRKRYRSDPAFGRGPRG